MPTLLPQPWPSGPVVVSTPRGFECFGMARAAAVQLAELLDLIERHGQFAGRLAVGLDLLHAGQMQHGIEQHRRMAARQHEPVAAGPDADASGS